jgi:hypothetical protein
MEDSDGSKTQNIVLFYNIFHTLETNGVAAINNQQMYLFTYYRGIQVLLIIGRYQLGDASYESVTVQ